jgi:hypothetical protein
MKKVFIILLIRIRKIRRSLKNSNVEADVRNKENLILELLTKELTAQQMYALKTSVDKRFKSKCAEFNRVNVQATKLYNSHFEIIPQIRHKKTKNKRL